MNMRDACEADYTAISKLAQRSDLLLGDLNERTFPAMLRWLHLSPPLNARLEVVAECDKEIVAHYGAMPLSYKLPGGPAIAAFGSNLVIDPKHRAGMLFFTLQGYFQRQYPRNGFSFALGLVTRPLVLEPHLRTGWKKIGRVPVYARPYNLPKIAAPYIRSAALRWLSYFPLRAAEAIFQLFIPRAGRATSVERCERFDESVAPFLERFMRSVPLAAIRSTESLNWRFGAYPERNYQIYIARRGGKVTGYMVTRAMPLKHLSGLSLVDIAFEPEDAATAYALLRRCDAVARTLNVDVTAALLNPHSAFLPYLRRFGFVKTPESFTLVVHQPKGVETLDLKDAFPQWHLTWFEHDYV